MMSRDRGRGPVDLRALAAERPVHFMGVGGAGMYPLAELLLRSGGKVSGCDAKESEALRRLRELGATIAVGHDASHAAEASALVATAAVPSRHPELEAARSHGIPVMKRAEALGAWVSHGTVVGIAGTHGKTTTTAMTTEILAAGGADPTGLVGGRVAAWEGNLRFGSDDLFVVEADEYDRSFLTLSPDVAVVTNLEADHLDIYGDLDGVRRGFQDFLAGVRGGGRVVACADDHGASSLLPGVGPAAYTYGTAAGAMLRASDIRVADGVTRARIHEEGRDVGEISLPMGGRHNLLNALGAAAAARALEVEWAAVFRALAGFQGIGRRFQRLGEARGVVVVDDYGHHPTEIAAALRAARSTFQGRRLVAVFQPHLFSRTRDFAREFGEALAMADEVWLTDIFPAREEPIAGVTGQTLVDSATAAGARPVTYVADLDELAPRLADELREGDVVLTMGAGSIERVGPALLDTLKEPAHA
ncbi:MAG: UDP-N-acetylmuramate--L-alanine ligase [Longimicrobiales bacterium]|nr:UDP-N-acetylmuramate--L-alanine ligase [Longimicrobiales bacterium]